jgi:hypothetical protein
MVVGIPSLPSHANEQPILRPIISMATGLIGKGFSFAASTFMTTRAVVPEISFYDAVVPSEPAHGIEKKTVVPLPSSLSTHILPP